MARVVPENWNTMSTEERDQWRENRNRELAELRARRAPRRERRAEIRQVNEEFAQGDDPPADPPEVEPFEEEPEQLPEMAPLPPDDVEDESEDALILRAAPVRRPHRRTRRIAEMPVADELQVDRDTLLAGLSEETRSLLTDADIDQILQEERLRASDEQRKKAREKAREEIRHRMRVEHGLLDAATLRTREQNERLKSKVRIRFDLPGDGAGHQGSNGIRIDGRLLAVRTWHTVSVAEYESIREMHYNAWINETQFKTLDQASRFGITTMNRLQGTTPARAIFSQQPNQVEMERAE